MDYISTRGSAAPRRFSEIVFKAFAEDGGLYVPREYPKFSLEEIAQLRGMDYASLALEIIHKFYPEIKKNDLWKICRDAFQPEDYPFGRDAISRNEVAPLTWMHDGVGLLELSNGPTLAFDDISMNFLSKLYSSGKSGAPSPLTLLGATSGDMGAAAEHAFADVPGVKVVMLSPKGRMSDFQRDQLLSCSASNVKNISIDGTFDECQDIVTHILTDEEFSSRHNLGALNATIWSRMASQIVYYFYSYIQAVEHIGEEVVYCVPGGNFGNAFAGWAAKKMGLPIHRLIIATNENDAMDQFFRTGTYSPRSSSETIATSSPSNDVSRAANFERFLFEVLGRNGARVSELASELKEKGSFTLTPEEFKVLRREHVYSGTSNHADRLEIIETMNLEYDHVVDPHTADCIYSGIYLHPVGIKTICLETVRPIKFPKIIMQAAGRLVETPFGFELPEKKDLGVQLPVDESLVRKEIAAMTA